MHYLYEFVIEDYFRDRFDLFDDPLSKCHYRINSYKTKYEKSVSLVKRQKTGEMAWIVKSDLPYGESNRAEELVKELLLQCLTQVRSFPRAQLLFKELTVTPIPKRMVKLLIKDFHKTEEKKKIKGLDMLRVNFYRHAKDLLRRVRLDSIDEILPLLGTYIKKDKQGVLYLNALLYLIRTNYFIKHRLIDCNDLSSSELEKVFSYNASIEKIYLIRDMKRSLFFKGESFKETYIKEMPLIVIDTNEGLTDQYKFRFVINDVKDIPSITTGKDKIDAAMASFDDLVGLEHVKQRVREILVFNHVHGKKRALVQSNHFAFLGPPGTGKTTVARLIGDAFKTAGVLTKGHLIEVDRSNLVGEYVGKTAKLTKAALNSAENGVLFVDEAYSFNSDGRDFGKEAINIITKHMEDHRDQMVMVFAGYEDKMKDLYKMNQGLRSRINHEFCFKPYSPDELFLIFKRIVSNMDFVSSEPLDEALFNLFRSLSPNECDGRMVRQIAESALRRQAVRCYEEDRKGDDLHKLRLEDFVDDRKVVNEKGVIGF